MTQFVTQGVQITRIMNNIQPDREIPKQSLQNIRQQSEINKTYKLPSKSNTLEYVYFLLSVLDMKQPIMQKRKAYLRLSDTLIEFENNKFPKTTLQKIRDACYANFQDLLSAYEANNPKKSSKTLADMLSTVPTATLWVIKHFDPEAMRHFEALFKSSYKSSFKKLLDQVLVERGITFQHDSQELAIEQLISVLYDEKDDLNSGHTFRRKKIEISSESSGTKTESDEDESKEKKTDNFKRVPKDVVRSSVHLINQGNNDQKLTTLKAFWNKFNCLD